VAIQGISDGSGEMRLPWGYVWTRRVAGSLSEANREGWSLEVARRKLRRGGALWYSGIVLRVNLSAGKY